MSECPYCDQAFEGESAIREHLYEEHERDDLSRIDRKRVDQYVDEHGLAESSETVDESDQPTRSEKTLIDATKGSYPADAWELRDVEELSTAEIVDKLADLGIETNEERFQTR